MCGKVQIIDSTGLFALAELTKGSFFGEFQVLNNVASPFELRARMRTKDNSSMDSEESDDNGLMH